ncbi:hypothetical protein RRG08_047929 [Elysia crispata]|uniref:Uncharacterized protein n=1 Tax=Elysia crispata TaxID=231223 RepID=A0AAE0ZLY4_9GAST|nr:hypothetical protein RRG08_047929 [Elysia crispata]
MVAIIKFDAIGIFCMSRSQSGIGPMCSSRNDQICAWFINRSCSKGSKVLFSKLKLGSSDDRILTPGARPRRWASSTTNRKTTGTESSTLSLSCARPNPNKGEISA